MWKKEDKLIRDLLLNSFGAFFLSMLTSSLGTLVLMLHFLKKDIIFRFTFRSPDWRSFADLVRTGLPKGVSRVTTSVRGIFINRTAAAIAAVAVAGYSVQSNLNYMTIQPPTSACALR